MFFSRDLCAQILPLPPTHGNDRNTTHLSFMYLHPPPLCFPGPLHHLNFLTNTFIFPAHNGPPRRIRGMTSSSSPRTAVILRSTWTPIPASSFPTTSLRKTVSSLSLYICSAM
ncbi:hypothetical protein DFH09DRAFT_1373640 [Mycena vulgaris]|nr:hypothetical protein DFH09DRAFT_1373640 [Mycena vulgaris]